MVVVIGLISWVSATSNAPFLALKHNRVTIEYALPVSWIILILSVNKKYLSHLNKYIWHFVFVNIVSINYIKQTRHCHCTGSKLGKHDHELCLCTTFWHFEAVMEKSRKKENIITTFSEWKSPVYLARKHHCKVGQKWEK